MLSSSCPTFATPRGRLSLPVIDPREATLGKCWADSGVQDSRTAPQLNMIMANIERILAKGAPTIIPIDQYVGKHGEFILDIEGGQIFYHDGHTVGGTSIAGGGGGASLTGLTVSLETKAPNDTTNATLLLASGGTPDQDFVIKPAGVGGFALALADGTSLGGNKRGFYAVDLQVHQSGKNSPTQVASGQFSFACGAGNTASDFGTFVSGLQSTASAEAAQAQGFGCIASAFCAHAEGSDTQASNNASHSEGQSTVASGLGAHAEGWSTAAQGDYSHSEGYQTQASQTGAHAEGYQCVASAMSAHAEGNNTGASGIGAHAEGVDTVADGYASNASGQQSWTRGILAMQSYSGGQFFGDGDRQLGRLCLGVRTPSNITKHMTSDGTSPTANNQFAIPIDATFACTVTVLGRAPATSDSAMYTFIIVLKCDHDGNITSLPDAPVTASTVFADTGASAWTCVGDIDATHQTLAVIVAGAADDVYWVAEVRSLELNISPPS